MLLGYQAENEKRQGQAISEVSVALGQIQSPFTSEGTTKDAKHQASWSLSVLWYKWQLQRS